MACDVGRSAEPHVPATLPSGAISTLLKFHDGANPASSASEA
jgi:hypothetical protein